MALENTDEYQKWLTKVQKSGYALQHVPDELKTKDLCLAAVQQTIYALEYIPEVLKTESLCLAAVQRDGLALEYAPHALKTESICLTAMRKNGFALRFVPKAMKTEELCFTAVKEDGDALEFVIRPNNQMATDAEQLASWNRILKEVDETDAFSKEHLHAQLIRPLITQVNKASQLPASVLDEIATLIEHCERLKINTNKLNTLYCEKQQLAKPPSKHKKCVSQEHTL